MNSELITRTITGIIIGIVVFTLLLIFPPLVITVALVACLAWILAYEWPQIAQPWGKNKWYFTLFYPILPFYTLIEINRANPHILPLLFLLVFSCDTGCYVFGKLFGTHLLAPSISPKKTWEGCIGGIVTTITMLFIMMRLYYGIPLPLLYCIALGIPIAVVAIAGDLFESWLKRKAKVKDTGALLPGHGGLLDRFDSMLFVAPFYYYFIM